MKKIMSVALACLLVFSATSVTSVDAKSRYGGSSKSNYKSNNSSKSYNGNSGSNYKNDSSYPNTNKSGNANSNTNSNNVYDGSSIKAGENDKNTTSNQTNNSNTNNASNYNNSLSSKVYPYKTPYSGSYYRPAGQYDYSKYKNKSYFNGATGFATGLLTATGLYLLLDSFDDEGEPVYIDAETGEVIPSEELDSLEVQPVEEEQQTTIDSTEKKSSEGDKVQEVEKEVSQEDIVHETEKEEEKKEGSSLLKMMGIIFIAGLGIMVFRILRKK